jgi:hypothetical protein
LALGSGAGQTNDIQLPEEYAMAINLRTEKVSLFLFTLVLVYQIFVSPIVGLNSNGDIVRIMHKVGIQPGDVKEYFGNIDLQLRRILDCLFS